MKYINVKRILLNIGLLTALAMLIFAGYSIYKNRDAAYTEAVMISSEPSENTYFRRTDGTEVMYETVYVEYLVDGTVYQGEILELPGDYVIGGKVEYCYNKNDPAERFFDTLSGNLTFAGSLFLAAGFLIVLFRKEFTGYKKDYLCRYKKSVMFSVVTGWIPILYYLWFTFVFEQRHILDGLLEFLFMVFLFLFIPVINVVVWIIAAVRYSRSQALKEKKGVDAGKDQDH